MKQFEIGKTYTMKSVCDHNTTWAYKVIARTAKAIKLEDDHGNVKTCRIVAQMSEWRGAESVMPLGTYSMAPVLSADKIAG